MTKFPPENDPKITKLDKYDVEANIDEVDNTDEHSVYKYAFTALSNPKNVRLSIEGTARIFGDSMERNEILDKDENDNGIELVKTINNTDMIILSGIKQPTEYTCYKEG